MVAKKTEPAKRGTSNGDRLKCLELSLKCFRISRIGVPLDPVLALARSFEEYVDKG